MLSVLLRWKKDGSTWYLWNWGHTNLAGLAGHSCYRTNRWLHESAVRLSLAVLFQGFFIGRWLISAVKTQACTSTLLRVVSEDKWGHIVIAYFNNHLAKSDIVKCNPHTTKSGLLPNESTSFVAAFEILLDCHLFVFVKNKPVTVCPLKLRN